MDKKEYIKINIDYYYQFISKNTTNAEIFVMVRRTQEEARKQNVEVEKPAAFYWKLIDYRDELLKDKKVG